MPMMIGWKYWALNDDLFSIEVNYSDHLQEKTWICEVNLILHFNAF